MLLACADARAAVLERAIGRDGRAPERHLVVIVVAAAAPARVLVDAAEAAGERAKAALHLVRVGLLAGGAAALARVTAVGDLDVLLCDGALVGDNHLALGGGALGVGGAGRVARAGCTRAAAGGVLAQVFGGPSTRGRGEGRVVADAAVRVFAAAVRGAKIVFARTAAGAGAAGAIAVVGSAGEAGVGRRGGAL